MIVARARVQKFHQVRAPFSEEPAVHAMPDRRQAQSWEDANVHSVVLVPLWRRAGDGAAALGNDRATTRITEGEGMDTRLEGEARERVLGWIQDGQQVLGRIIPGLFEENEALRKRLVDAERETERLRGDNDRLREQLGEMKDRHQLAATRQTEIVDSVGRFVSSMSQILEPMRELADKLQRTPRSGA